MVSVPGGSTAVEPPAAAGRGARPAIRLTGLRKRYGDTLAVAGVDLDIADGEFFTMLGPSGSGKTTLLRVIAGFERPDAGRVELHGVDVTGRPPYDRDVNTVFQDYALFPHLSVQDNVEYGLRVAGVRAAERRRRAGEALDMVGLAGRGGSRPAQLSGGQRQRVALARAIVKAPQVLLLDEPLGALDLKLRQGMQLELKRIQREVRLTFVYVTHDQDEALTMSDRVAVFRSGRVEQVGSPVEIYERPSTAFVADFIGTANTLAAGGRRYTVRPERIRLLDAGEPVPAGAVAEPGTIAEVGYLGMVTRLVVALDRGGSVVAVRQNVRRSQADAPDERGRPVRAVWDPADAHELVDRPEPVAGSEYEEDR